MKKFYVLSAPKEMLKGFFNDGSWTTERMTSVIVKRENGKLIQIFGSQGTYGSIGENVELISDRSCRTMGYGMIVRYVDLSKELFISNAATYVFK